MSPKLFATGATGYIGGTALDAIIETHPDYEITALVRSSEKASLLKSKYPNVTTVSGDLDTADVLTTEAQKADIVLHFADCDHVASARALTSALSASSKRSFFIHTSGAAILPDVNNSSLFGTAPTQDDHYSDTATLSKITSFPESGHLHRDVDKIVLSTPAHVSTAIVCPPTIYGRGRGAGNVRSNQIPELVRLTLKRGKAFSVGEGKSTWNNVHVRDLAALYLKLVEAAVAGGEGVDWNEEGYYFAENGTHCWGEIAGKIAKIAKEKGYLKTDEVEKLSVDEVVKLHPFGAVLWGTNSSGKAERARKLGWTPKCESLEETLEDVIEDEAKKLGL